MVDPSPWPFLLSSFQWWDTKLARFLVKVIVFCRKKPKSEFHSDTIYVFCRFQLICTWLFVAFHSFRMKKGFIIFRHNLDSQPLVVCQNFLLYAMWKNLFAKSINKRRSVLKKGARRMLVFVICGFIKNVLPNSYFILQIYHVKSFKMMHVLSLYFNFSIRYS